MLNHIIFSCCSSRFYIIKVWLQFSSLFTDAKGLFFYYQVGLCHKSQLSDDHIEDIGSKYKAGEEIKVKILKVNYVKTLLGKISMTSPLEFLLHLSPYILTRSIKIDKGFLLG